MKFMSHLPMRSSILVSDAILILVSLNPFHLLIRHQTLAYPFETSHGTSLLCSRYFLKFEFESTSATFLDVIDQIIDLAEVCSSGNLFVSTMKIPKEGRRLHHDDRKQRNEDINVLDRSLREEQATMRRFVKIS